MDSMASFFVIVLTAVVSSFFGFREWRKQLVLKKRHDLAEDVLALFYQCEGLFRHIRNVFGFQGEAADREPWPNETPGQKRDLDMAYVPVARYNENREASARSSRFGFALWPCLEKRRRFRLKVSGCH